MLFNSLEFLIFLPIVLLVYFVMPKKVKIYWLLFASYYFYMCWNAEYALLILFSTVVTFASGLLMERVKQCDKKDADKTKLKKLIVSLSFTLNLAVLFFYKYFNFTADLISDGLGLLNIELNVPQFDVILPVGISFYTFQALSYTMDIYRDEIYAEKNFFRYALFVSYFPQLVAGPIERSKKLLRQLAVPQKFNFEKARKGLLLMLWGFFLKIVIADRAAVFVDTVYSDYEQYTGWYLIVATILFAVQIYCDFYGYSIIAVGASKMLNIDLIENFNAPYLATSVADFWRGWHISLTSWFRDYLYIPLGGSRKGKIRKYFNKMVVFLVSGLWHGASLSFVVWGGLNGLYQIFGEITKPLRDKAVKALKLDRNTLGHRLMQITVTFVLIDFSWIFFRASDIKEALRIIELMFTTFNPWVIFDGSLYNCGLDSKNFFILMLSVLILVFADICKHKGIKIHEIILKQDYWFRILFIAVAIILILLFGIWGPSYEASNFIYFQF